ncbi:MAG TPA: carboxypeptidase-like regulatory domain-containing protein [Cyclobacteriaceae bacterium]|nr:carboxypeptidase-like regulatory domain-containing protein [Cyclobacteriaceae bacterium]
MSSLSDDIIKYRKGELSPQEMHRLEKRALADPFLADALEGLESISAENLADDVSSINSKIQNKRKITLFTPLRMAAGIILVAASVFLIYQFTPEKKSIALNAEKPKPEVERGPKKPEATRGAGIAKTENDEKADSEKLKTGHKTKRPDVKSDSKGKATHQNPVQTPATVQSIQQSPVQDLAALDEAQQAKKNADQAKAEEEVKAGEIVSQENRAEGLSVMVQKKKESFALSSVQRNAQPASKIQPDQFIRDQIIQGHVVSAEDNSPLPGVAVVLKGTAEGTVTDGEGNYKIRIDSVNQHLVFSFIGFQPQEVGTSGGDKIDIQMKGDVSQLSEIVVTGFGKTKDDQAEPLMKWAEPEGGRKAYDHYLESSVQYPEEALKNKIKGKSGIEFTVGVDGSLNDFRVIKKLGYGCDEEVIRLVKEGPRWNPTTEDDKPIESIVRVRLRFDPAKKGK